MPGYIYIPSGIDKLYFSIANSNAGGGGFKSEAHINSAFNIQDNSGNILKARLVNPNDSALFYIEVPRESVGKFCRITRKFYQYSLVFSNVNNFLWYAQPKPKPCPSADFRIDVVKKNGNCITQLTAIAKTGQFDWEITDLGQTYTYSNQRVVEISGDITHDATVTLFNGADCALSKKIGDDKKFMATKQACAGIGAETEITVAPVLYPNPSTGVFKLMQTGAELTASQVVILNVLGNQVAVFSNTSQFNISNLPPGMYWCKIVVNGHRFSEKLVKL
jgi:hypothetical protein